MPKTKHGAEPKGHKIKRMDKVKIKRVKHAKKKISTKEKILAGLGVGSTLLGGAGAISAQSKNNTQFVRTTDTESKGTSKIKSVLKNVFGIKEAKADASIPP